jgi:hypothetical protein
MGAVDEGGEGKKRDKHYLYVRLKRQLQCLRLHSAALVWALRLPAIPTPCSSLYVHTTPDVCSRASHCFCAFFFSGMAWEEISRRRSIFGALFGTRGSRVTIVPLRGVAKASPNVHCG